MLPNLKIHVLPIGHGDCIIIEFPDKSWAVIDCGAKTNNFYPASIASTYIYQKSLKDSYIRFVLVTHPDTDHDGGIYDFMSHPPRDIHAFYYSVKRLVDTDESFGILQYTEEAENLYKQNILKDFRSLKAGDCIPTNIFDLSIKVLGPSKRHIDLFSNNLKSSINRNRLSLVVQISYGSNTVLLCGDATIDALKDIFGSERIDFHNVVKFPHHGRKDRMGFLEFSTSNDKKTVVIISCPSLNKDAPDNDILKRLWNNKEIKVRCTGFSSHCDIKNIVSIPTKESLRLPSSIERALRAPFREMHPDKWQLCCSKLIVTVPNSGEISVVPETKNCDLN